MKYRYKYKWTMLTMQYWFSLSPYLPLPFFFSFWDSALLFNPSRLDVPVCFLLLIENKSNLVTKATWRGRIYFILNLTIHHQRMQTRRKMAAFSVYVCLPSSSLPPSFSPLFPLSLRGSHVSWASLICSWGWLGTHVFLPPLPKFWDSRHVPLLPGYAVRISIRVLPGIHSADQVHINCIPSPVLIHHLCNQTITEHLSCKYFYFLFKNADTLFVYFPTCWNSFSSKLEFMFGMWILAAWWAF